jgi:transposase, IS5 family
LAFRSHGVPGYSHTLKDVLNQAKRIIRDPKHVFVDMGYCGHRNDGEAEVYVNK